jgi:hypothetical protein
MAKGVGRMEEGYKIIRCPKCNKWKVVEPPKEPMPADLMEMKQIEKCSCDDILQANPNPKEE